MYMYLYVCLQLQAGNNPVPEPMVQSAETPAIQGGENRISAMFKNLISKLVNVHVYMYMYTCTVRTGEGKSQEQRIIIANGRRLN